MTKEEEQKLKIPLPKNPEKALEMINERYDGYPVDHPEREPIRAQMRKYEEKISKR